MKKLDNVKYEKMNYDNFDKRINSVRNNFSKKTIAKSEYGYDIDCYSIGKGDHELFLVAGTHSSEIITVDFITQLMENIENLSYFDPNYFKVNIIPIQNPEGFDIVSSSVDGISDFDLQEKSFEYYKRYRTDCMISSCFRELDKMVMNNNSDASLFLDNFKEFVRGNSSWIRLSDKNAIPNIRVFNDLVCKIDKVDSYGDFKNKIFDIINGMDTESDYYLDVFLRQLRSGFDGVNIWNGVRPDEKIKLFQDMFKDSSIKNLRCYDLERDMNNIYKLYNCPKGSNIVHDSTGVCISLNANNEFNPGIDAIRNKKLVYGPMAKDNIRNYQMGPIGIPCSDVYNFDYAVENKALYDLIMDSYNRGSYVATLLYHGTGGLIYYKPYQDLMDSNSYDYFINYNYDIANAYNKDMNYRLIESASSTGYGDLLRRLFPGVILVELSRMGGNPIAPYGDMNNIYNTINDNLCGINNLFKYLMKRDVKVKKKGL